MYLASNLTFLRKHSKLDVRQVSKHLKLFMCDLMDYENGNCSPTVDVANKLADFYKLELGALLFRSIADMTPRQVERYVVLPDLATKIMNTNENTGPSFTWREVKAIADSLNEEQLDMPAVYSIADKKDGTIMGISICQEDYFTDDELIAERSAFSEGYIKEHELELTYKQGQPIIDLQL